ncbi:hypothetical protein NFW88_002822, partial [Enterococcus faecalis]|nr:hypothetical protein [Enterococcus faecalis]
MKFIVLCVLVLFFSGCSKTEKNNENPQVKENTSSLYKTNSSKTNITETNNSTVNKKEDKGSISESSKKDSEEQTVITSKNESTNELPNTMQSGNQSVDAPYAVSLQQIAELKTFDQPYMSGSFAVDLMLDNGDDTKGVLTFHSRSRKEPEKIETRESSFVVNTVPTKEIRVFSNNKIGSGIRTVKVNTEIIC